MTRTVPIDRATLAAHGLTAGDLVASFPGTVLVMADGSAWRVTETGGLDSVLQGAMPGGRSIAADPAARTTTRFAGTQPAASKGAAP